MWVTDIWVVGEGVGWGACTGWVVPTIITSLTSPPFCKLRVRLQYATVRAKLQPYPLTTIMRRANPVGITGGQPRQLCYTLVIGLIDPIPAGGFPGDCFKVDSK
jgi:hypothetical protein